MVAKEGEMTVYLLERSRYLGSARRLAIEPWVVLNAVHLRERWRRLIDISIEANQNVPDEREYAAFCASQYEAEAAL